MRFPLRIVVACLGLLVCLALPPGVLLADELAPDRASLARIEALKPNEGALLGRARVSGDFNEVARRFDLQRTGPRSRNYSLKMVWAPDRGRALFLGANHGQPHRLNDVWEFDLAAMSWILLYAPDNPRSYDGLGDDASDVVFEDGVLRTRRGGPAVIGHAWWGATYDPVHRQLLFMNIWPTKQDAAIRQLGGDPAARYKGPPLWAFDPATRRWLAVKTPPGPGSPYGAMLEYVPDLRGAVWHMNNWQMSATWLYSPAERAWSRLPVNQDRKDFQAQAPGRELIGYYDPLRKIIVAQHEKSTYHFDVARNEWTKVLAESADSIRVPRGNDARAVFYHDHASGKGLLLDLKARELWVYDPGERTWARLQPDGDPMPNGERMLAYLDPSRNVLAVINDTSVWVYRYKSGCPHS